MSNTDQVQSRYLGIRSPELKDSAFVKKPSDLEEQQEDKDTLNRSRSRYHRKSSKDATSQSPSMSLKSPSAAQASPPIPDAKWAQPGQDTSKIGGPITSQTVIYSIQSNIPPAEEGNKTRQNSGSTHATETRTTRSRPVSPVKQQISSDSDAPKNITASRADLKPRKSSKWLSNLFKRKKSNSEEQETDQKVGSSVHSTATTSTTSNSPRPIEETMDAGMDAPKSAVNAGERRVTVVCGKSRLQFPITPATTAGDLIQSASNCFSEPIDPKTFVLIELFGKVGVQRPLRRYEYIREVLNSWDEDQRDTLEVMPGNQAGSNPTLLNSSQAPKSQPEAQTFTLTYSHKVGKWDERCVTLKSDGQVVVKKNAETADQYYVNVCHLSDFDVYMPTLRQTSRKVRPPQKFCFAIKSQQKTAMFEDLSTYVHFFCTGEKDHAIGFYTAVQQWRSWYLMNIVREKAKVQGASDNQTDPSEDAKYRLGTFIPLINARVSAVPSSITAPRSPRLGDDEPLVNMIGKNASVDNRKSIDGENAHNLVDRTRSIEHKSGSTSPSKRNSRSIVGQRSSVDMPRNNTVPTKPLVDLTPQAQVPPQHQPKGRGFHPDNIGAGGLIEAATSADKTLTSPPPSSNTIPEWRSPFASTAQSQRNIHSSPQDQPSTQRNPSTSSQTAGLARHRSNTTSQPVTRQTTNDPLFPSFPLPSAVSADYPPLLSQATRSFSNGSDTLGVGLAAPVPTIPLPPIPHQHNPLLNSTNNNVNNDGFIPGGLLSTANVASSNHTNPSAGNTGNGKRPLVEFTSGEEYVPGSLLARQAMAEHF